MTAMKVSRSDIKSAQRLLHIEPTGQFDELTSAAVRNFQLKNHLPPTGALDPVTRESLFVIEGDLTTDLSDQFENSIQDYLLPDGEFVKDKTKKEYIFLHHTAGWNSPFRTIDMWANDQRGRIGTHYVIGGINRKTGDDSEDGVTLRAIKDKYYAWHLGSVDRYMHKHSIGIELCNFGWLTKKGSDYYTYVNTKVDPKQVIDLGYKFRGYRYWHKYSDAQIESLRSLLIYLCDTHGISPYLGLQERFCNMSPSDALGYYDEAKYGEIKGILSHTSVRKDKWDVFPQEELIDMILSL